MKTFQANIKEVKRAWHLIDAKSDSLGRISTQVVQFLMGKQKVSYTPNLDLGDNVLVINADKLILTGKKLEQKTYKSHSGYPGGFKEVKASKLFKERPEEIIKKAVSGMLPQNKLKKLRLARLTIVKGEENPLREHFNQNEKSK